MNMKAPKLNKKGYAVLTGDCLESLAHIPDGTFDCCVTSPPYFGLRDYENDGQRGMEDTPEDFVQGMVEVFREVRRCLKDEGTLWLNIGDGYAGSGKGRMADGSRPENEDCLQATHKGSLTGKVRKSKTPDCKAKDLIGIPWMLAFALRADGWYLRQDIIWAKPNPMPESVKDRCTKSHEHIFLLAKSRNYYYDNEAIKERSTTRDTNMRDRDSESNRLNKTPGRTRMAGLKHNDYAMKNKRDVWSVSPKPYSGAHFAVYPMELIEPCILTGCPEGGLVLDPFGGSGTTAAAAIKHKRKAVLCELNEEYAALVPARISECLSAKKPKPVDPKQVRLY